MLPTRFLLRTLPVLIRNISPFPPYTPKLKLSDLAHSPDQPPEVAAVRKIESFPELEQLLLGQEKGKLSVVNFFAEWCPPCRLSLKAFAGLAEEFPAVNFLAVDVDRVPEVLLKFDIDAVPKFVFVRNRERIGRVTGPKHKMLRSRIQEVLGVDDSSTTNST